MNKQGYLFDAFISHTVEDKIPIANELCHRLEKAGAKIWYCGRELNAGDSVRKSIKEGLSRSRYGIVILSKSYLTKSWNLDELGRFITGQNTDKKNIFPVLYDVSTEDLLKQNAAFATGFAYRIGNSLDNVIDHLVTEINGVLPRPIKKKGPIKQLGNWLRRNLEKKLGI